MLSIYLQTLKDRRTALIAYLIGSVAFMWMYIALFPYMKDQAETLSKVMDAYPKGFMEAFGVSDVALAFSRIGSYLATEMFSFIYPIMAVAIVVGAGSSAIAGEIERGTIEFLLSQPMSRVQLFFAKYLAATSNILVFSFVTVFSIIPLAKIYHADYVIGDIARFWVVAFLFGLSIMCLTFLASAVFSDKGKPSFIVTGLLVIMYVLNILATLKPSLDKLKYFSFFHYYNPPSVLGKGEALDHQMLWVFLGVSLVSTIIAAWWFNRRDIATS